MSLGCQSINQVFAQLSNLLIEKLNACYVLKERSISMYAPEATQNGEDITLSATVVDENDNPVPNSKVKFYSYDKIYNKNITISGDNTTQKDSDIQLTATITDTDNNPLKDEIAYFYVDNGLVNYLNEDFTHLINAVGDIQAIEVDNSNNIKPAHMPEIDNTNISSFYITLYKRIRYYMKLIGYYLILKGVPVEEVYRATSLKELIELIDLIDVIVPSFLSLAHVDETQYYGTSIIVDYILKDVNGFDIEEGDITVTDSNGIVYDSIEAGKPIMITPLSITEKINGEYEYETFTVMYHGTDNYRPSKVQTFSVKILPAKIHLTVNMTNISTNSRYYNSSHTGCETDEWLIEIYTYDYQNQPLPYIPLDLSFINNSVTSDRNIILSENNITQADESVGIVATITDNSNDPINGAVVALYTGELEPETDENGVFSFNQILSQAGNYSINCATDYEDIDKMSNSSVEYNVTIKYNILRQSTNRYTDYVGKDNYTYEIEIIDEDTGLKTNRYDGEKVKLYLDDELVNNGIITINNGKASYTFTSMDRRIIIGYEDELDENNQPIPIYDYSDDKTMKWSFTHNNFTAEINTYLKILSNFIVPDEHTFFLNDTPNIYYLPNGTKSSNNTVTGTITYEKTTYSNNTRYEIVETPIYKTHVVINDLGVQTIFDEETEEETVVLDEHGNPVHIYEEEEIIDLDSNGNPIILGYTTEEVEINETIPETQEYTENISLTTDNNGKLDISNYKDISLYTLRLNAGNSLDESCVYEYELKQPFDIELVDYNKKEFAQYQITVYDTDDDYNINITNQNNTINNTLYSLTTPSDNDDEYTVLTLMVPISNATIGTNILSFSINGYTQTSTFKFVNQVFTLLTTSVPLGEGRIQIRCHDDEITTMNIDSEYIDVMNITYNNSIFTVDGIFKQAGTIVFDAIDESSTTEELSINVTKVNLSDDIDIAIAIKEAQNQKTKDNKIAYIDRDNAVVLFSINKTIYSDLTIYYIINQGNNQISAQSFTYYNNYTEHTDNVTETILTLQNLTVGEYEMEFAFAGDNNYLVFDKKVTFEILDDSAVDNIVITDIRISEGDLIVTEINRETVNNTSLVNVISIVDGDLIIENNNAANPLDIDEALNAIGINSNRDIIYTQVKDEVEE